MNSPPKFCGENHLHFVTSKTYDNVHYFKDSGNCDILVRNLKFYADKYQFEIFAYVIMPNHFHLIISEGKKEKNVSKIVQQIKSFAAREILIKSGERDLSHRSKGSCATHLVGMSKPLLGQNDNPTSSGRSEPLLGQNDNPTSSGRSEPLLGLQHTKTHNKIWQNSFFDFNITTEKKLIEKINYIQNHLYKHNLDENYPYYFCRYE